jgi:hypothetical protein
MSRMLNSILTTASKYQGCRDIQGELRMDFQESVYCMDTVYQSTRIGAGLVP